MVDTNSWLPDVSGRECLVLHILMWKEKHYPERCKAITFVLQMELNLLLSSWEGNHKQFRTFLGESLKFAMIQNLFLSSA